MDKYRQALYSKAQRHITNHGMETKQNKSGYKGNKHVIRSHRLSQPINTETDYQIQNTNAFPNASQQFDGDSYRQMPSQHHRGSSTNIFLGGYGSQHYETTYSASYNIKNLGLYNSMLTQNQQTLNQNLPESALARHRQKSHAKKFKTNGSPRLANNLNQEYSGYKSLARKEGIDALSNERQYSEAEEIQLSLNKYRFHPSTKQQTSQGVTKHMTTQHQK